MQVNTDLEKVEKSFLDSYEACTFLFINAIYSILLTFVVVFIACTQTKLKTSVSSLALQQIKRINAVSKHEHIYDKRVIECTCILYECKTFHH